MAEHLVSSNLIRNFSVEEKIKQKIGEKLIFFPIWTNINVGGSVNHKIKKYDLSEHEHSCSPILCFTKINPIALIMESWES